MNKALIISMFVLMIALVAGSASATLTVSDVQFGDVNQERNQTVTSTITITNNDITVVAAPVIVQASDVVFTADSQYKLNVTGPSLTLNPAGSGSSGTFVLNAVVPKRFDAVDANLNAQVVGIGTYSVKGLATGKISMQANNKLKIKDMTIFVNGESQSISNNERVDNIKPGDKISLEINAKNEYSDRSDVAVDMDSVIVNTLSNNLDKLDVDDEQDLGSISSKSDSNAKVDFTVADDTDDNTYTLTIKAHGVDVNGGKHGEIKTIRLRVVRESHEISFKRQPQALPATVACDGSRVVTVDATVINSGQHKEDAVVVEADVPQLKFNKKITSLKLDKSKSKTVQFPIDIPENTKAGTYHVDLNTYFENSVKSSTKSASFEVLACQKEEPVVTPAPQPVPVTPAPQPQPVPVAPAPKARITTTTSSFTDSANYVYLLAGASVVMVFFLIVIVAVLASRRKHDED